MINIKLENVAKKFPEFDLLNINLEVESGKSYIITGDSGKGKTTILNLISMLENCDSGDIYLLGNKNPKLDSKVGRKILKNDLGYMFQNYGLVDDETVLENLLLVSKIKKLKNRLQKIQKALRIVGLSGYESRKVYSLSGGEAQRVAIVKLILKNPSVILADEPTGNLDKENSYNIIKLLLKLVNEHSSLVVVSHETELVKYFDEHITL